MADGFNSENEGFSFNEEGQSYNIYRRDRSEKKVKKANLRFWKKHTYHAEDKESDGKNGGFLGTVFEWLDVVVISVVSVVLVFTFLFRIVSIDGDSMLNTLHHGERVIISNLFYTPSQGDIVVISRNTENSAENALVAQPIIKRVIATEGQTINIDFETGIITVDGSYLYEPYIKELTHVKGDVTFPVRVPENCVFVLGDNRNNSSDSRYSSLGENGMVNEKYILGKAIYRISPLGKMGGLYDENNLK